MRSTPLVEHSAGVTRQVNHTGQSINASEGCVLVKNIEIVSTDGFRTPSVPMGTLPTDVTKIATSVTRRALQKITARSSMIGPSGFVRVKDLLVGVRFTRGLVLA